MDMKKLLLSLNVLWFVGFMNADGVAVENDKVKIEAAITDYKELLRLHQENNETDLFQALTMEVQHSFGLSRACMTEYIKCDQTTDCQGFLAAFVDYKKSLRELADLQQKNFQTENAKKINELLLKE